METQQNLFSYADNKKYLFEELFTPTLNGIAVSVRGVSYTPVFLNVGLDDKLRRTQRNDATRNEKNHITPCFNVEHEH